jgi:hypothetical protein
MRTKANQKKTELKKRFLNRVGDGPLIHEGDLEIKVEASDEKEEDENDVGDRRIKVAANFARKKNEEFSHGGRDYASG